MTTFEITIIVLLAAIVVLLIVLLRTDIEWFHGVWKNQDCMYQDIQRIEVNTHHASSVLQDKIIPEIERVSSDTMVLKAYFNGLLERLDNMTDEGGTLQQQLNDLAVNVKGNYNTLEDQQEDIYYIRTRINHILSLMHPAEEVIKSDAPTALDGLSNVQKDNVDKSTNYNGYDPTLIVRGSETTDKED